MSGWDTTPEDSDAEPVKEPSPNDAQFFDEGEGFVFVKLIDGGIQGETTIVRSIVDGELYVRKKLAVTSVPECISQEDNFYHLLPKNMAPELIHTTKYETAKGLPCYAHVYAFCNGGTLDDFIEKCKDKDAAIPESLFWELSKRLCNMVALAHSGYFHVGINQEIQDGTQANWSPIIHSDIHAGNIFLHWHPASSPPFPFPNFQIPHFLVGDWSRSQVISNHKTTNRQLWLDGETLDLSALLQALLNLHETQIGHLNRAENAREGMGVLAGLWNRVTPCKENCAIAHFKRIWEEAKVLSVGDKEFSQATYIAAGMAGVADLRIAELTSEEGGGLDFRWTRPDAVVGYGKAGDAIVRGKQGDRGLVQPWEWIEASKLPLATFTEVDERTQEEIFRFHRLPSSEPERYLPAKAKASGKVEVVVNTQLARAVPMTMMKAVTTRTSPGKRKHVHTDSEDESEWETEEESIDECYCGATTLVGFLCKKKVNRTDGRPMFCGTHRYKRGKTGVKKQ